MHTGRAIERLHPERKVDNLSIIDVLSIHVLQHPLSNEHAKRLIAEILKSGAVGFSNHALEEMANDTLTTVDVANGLRGGIVEFSEEVRRTWRYRVRTSRMTVVVAFRSEHALTVVTAWRKTR